MYELMSLVFSEVLAGLSLAQLSGNLDVKAVNDDVLESGQSK